MKMLKIVVSLLIIYFLICIKYYFRYNFPEIVQIPNGLKKRDIKYYFDDNASFRREISAVETSAEYISI